MGDGGESHGVATKCETNRSGVLREDLDAADRFDHGCFADGEQVRVARRQQIAVVRELALDQAGAEPGATRFERSSAIAEADLQLFDIAEETLQFVEGPAGDQHLLTSGEHTGVGKVTDGEAVRVGGDHAQAVVVRGQEYSGEHRSGVVGRCRPNDLPQCVGHGVGRQHDGLAGWLGLARVVVERQGSHGEL